MNKIYSLLGFIIIGLIGITFYFYQSMISKEIETAEDRLYNHVQISGNNIEWRATNFESEIKYILDVGNYNKVFINGKLNKDLYQRCSRLIKKYQSILDTIHIVDDEFHSIITKDKYNYIEFKTYKAEKNESLKNLRTINSNDKQPKVYYPILSNSGVLLANFSVSIKVEEMILDEFKNYYLGNESWKFIFSEKGEIKNYLYSEVFNFEEKPVIDKEDFSEIKSRILEGLEGKSVVDISYKDDDRELLTIIYPIRLFEKKIGLMFAYDRLSLITPIRVNFLLVLVIILTIIIVITSVFFSIIKQRNVALAELRGKREELSKLVDHQQLLLTHSNNFIYRRNLDGKFNFVNDSVEQILGYSPSELELSIQSLFTGSPLNVQFFQNSKAIEKYKMELNPYNIELFHKDGSKKVIELSEKPIVENEKAVGVIGVAKDISEKYNAELLLRESEERFRLISENMRDLICLHKPDGKFIYVSPSVYDLLGYRPENLFGLSPRDYIKKSTLDKKLYYQLLHENETYIESTVLGVDGNEIILGTIIRTIRNSAGRIQRLLSASRDITAQKMAEKALLKSESQFRAIFNSAAIGIAITDLNGYILDVNPIIEKISYFTKDDLIGKRDSDFVEFEEDNKNLKDLINGKINYYSFESEFPRKDGTVRWGKIIRSIVRDENNEGMFLIGMLEDITESKKYQEILNKAKEEAVAGSKAKSKFLATMSHEIRTPLNGVVSMSNLLMKTKLNKEQFEYAEIIKNSSEVLSSLIDDILDYSKIEAGKLELDLEEFNLLECIEGTVKMLLNKAQEKKLDILYQIDSDVPEVILGDFLRLRQILINLINNALKFTDRGDIIIDVKAQSHSEGKIKLQFCVSDTGIGIKDSEQKLLFKSFSQVDSGTTRKYGGTGLGLRICKSLSELMGGEIWLESEYGKGSDFYFTIFAKPIRYKETDEYEKLFKVKSVLLICENKRSSDIYKQVITNWGFSSINFESFNKFLAEEKTANCDILLLDYSYNETEFNEVVNKIMRNGNEYKPLIVALHKESNNLDVLNGNDDIKLLNKPVTHSELFDTINDFLVGGEKITDYKTPVNAEKIEVTNEIYPLKILVAEDNETNQRIMKHLLSKLGYEIEIAVNGIEVIEKMEKVNYDLIFMDIQMPEMDGLEATKTIRKKFKFPVKVFALTANATSEDRVICLDAGADDYLSKPININKIKKIISKHFDMIKED